MKLATGHAVRHFERIDSTNAEARRLAEGGEMGPLWLLADEQTLGRGRLGRSWVSEPGNFHGTFLLTVAAPPAVAAQVSFVAALGVRDAVRALCPGLEPGIKWPNDLLIGGAKFCGILPEVVGANPTRIAIGCGINLAHAPGGTPYPVTALGRGIGPSAVLAMLDASLTDRLGMWETGKGFPAIRREWEKHAIGIGGEATVEAAGETLSGTFLGLAEDGALRIRLPGDVEKRIHAGEVRFSGLERLNRTP